MRIILASASPRRTELLNLINIKHEIIISNALETFEKGLSIEEQSMRLSYIKAKAVFDKTSGDRIVIGSDTMVIKNNKIYGKPINNQDAISMLQELKNDKHQVITSLTVLIQVGNDFEEYNDFDIAEVYLKDISNDEILKWVNSGCALDKAGAYAIQSEFSVYVEKIIGNYTTIVGLPVHKLYNVIKKYL